jgi:uncharacterized DUF497 family protein
MKGARTFEWDDGKAAANIAKHGVSFQTAVAAFDDPHGAIKTDDRFEYGEQRFRLYATVAGFPICVAFTIRGAVTRIISARKTNRKER